MLPQVSPSASQFEFDKRTNEVTQSTRAIDGLGTTLELLRSSIAQQCERLQWNVGDTNSVDMSFAVIRICTIPQPKCIVYNVKKIRTIRTPSLLYWGDMNTRAANRGMDGRRGVLV